MEKCLNQLGDMIKAAEDNVVVVVPEFQVAIGLTSIAFTQIANPDSDADPLSYSQVGMPALNMLRSVDFFHAQTKCCVLSLPFWRWGSVRLFPTIQPVLLLHSVRE